MFSKRKNFEIKPSFVICLHILEHFHIRFADVLQFKYNQFPKVNTEEPPWSPERQSCM